MKKNPILPIRAGSLQPTEPAWVRAWKGDKKALPVSHGKAIDHARTVQAQLSATIATFFGDRSGDTAVLEAFFDKIAAGERIVCQSCNANLFPRPVHADGCELFKWYELVQQPAPSLDVYRPEY